MSMQASRRMRLTRARTYPFAPPPMPETLFHLAYAAVHLAYVTLSLGAAIHHLALAGRALRQGQWTGERR